MRKRDFRPKYLETSETSDQREQIGETLEKIFRTRNSKQSSVHKRRYPIREKGLLKKIQISHVENFQVSSVGEREWKKGNQTHHLRSTLWTTRGESWRDMIRIKHCSKHIKKAHQKDSLSVPSCSGYFLKKSSRFFLGVIFSIIKIDSKSEEKFKNRVGYLILSVIILPKEIWMKTSE